MIGTVPFDEGTSDRGRRSLEEWFALVLQASHAWSFAGSPPLPLDPKRGQREALPESDGEVLESAWCGITRELPRGLSCG